jgi:uncharacterized protein involved in exopolysaccharide biosynthesis
MLRDQPPQVTDSDEPVFLPRIGTMEAARRYWLLVLVPLLIGLFAGVALAVQRSPVYTAETRMTVGGVDVSQPGALSGFAVAGEQLAQTYSRAISAEAVVAPVARRTGLSSDTIRARVSATPVPNSPVFRVSAEGGSATQALDIANLTAVSLQRYVSRLNQPVGSSSKLFSQYQRAATQYASAQRSQQDSAGAFARAHTEANRRAVVSSQAAFQAAGLKLKGLTNAYLSSVGGGTSGLSAEQLAQATSASSDRSSRLQLFGLLGMLAGLLVGLALATSSANRAARWHLEPR